MHRRFAGSRLVVASHNAGKVREIRDLLAPFKADVISASELHLPEPEETALTFIGNAELKAHAAATGANLPALADDSGLVIDALDGAPGIYSARWAGPTKDFAVAFERIQRATTGKTNTRAHFVCALSLAWPDGHVESFEGKISGHLTFPPRGDKGFGYDPIFITDGFEVTFAQMEPHEKYAISHRADAFRQLVAAAFQ